MRALALVLLLAAPALARAQPVETASAAGAVPMSPAAPPAAAPGGASALAPSLAPSLAPDREPGLAQPATADDGAHASPYRVDYRYDLPVLGLGLAGTSIAFIPIPPADCVPDCVPLANLNALDEAVLGNYSGTAHTIADISVLTLVLSPIVLDLLDSGGEGWVDDMTVYAQTLALAQSAVQLTKVAVRRNAPLLYGSDAPLEIQRSADANRSFISGHTTMSFAAVTAFTVTYWLRNPDDPLRWVILFAGQALALGVGLLKIEAGYHYPTDIAAGALVGASIGALVPLLHAW